MSDAITTPGHTFDLVLDTLHRLTHAGLATWLSGGWAEELWGLCSPRPHQDIDLLYPASDFAHMDQWLATATDLTDIPTKRFSHKRAFFYQRIMVEIILLEPGEKGGYLTNFFSKSYQFAWPPNSLSTLTTGGQDVSVASCEALQQYRAQHQCIIRAYQLYLQNKK